MPARDIKLGDMTLHVHGQYMSEHSDAEYETMRKAFLRLGEDYGSLKKLYKANLNSSVELQNKCNKLQKQYVKLQSKYDKLLDDYNHELDSDLDELYNEEW